MTPAKIKNSSADIARMLLLCKFHVPRTIFWQMQETERYISDVAFGIPVVDQRGVFSE